MVLSKQETRDLYRKRARWYDAAIWLYHLVGFQMNKYRSETLASLALRPGDRVVELGCGTGLNFPWLQKAVGQAGSIVGVDLTDAMLAQARRRLTAAGWHNVELVQADLADYEIPRGVAGILTTLAITLVPEYDRVIQRGAVALREGGRLAVLDIKEPDNWPTWLKRSMAWLSRHYGVSMELADRKPMESVRRYLREVKYREYYFGMLYLSVGEAG